MGVYNFCHMKSSRLCVESGAVGMQVANVKLRQILPRVGKIWASTPQNRTYRAWEPRRASREFEVFKVSAEYPVRLGNRTYRAWRIAKLTLMVDDGLGDPAPTSSVSSSAEKIRRLLFNIA